MSQPSIAELQKMVRDIFGRELTVAQAEAYRRRLPTMARAVYLLQEWEERLRESEPAAVHRTPDAEGGT